MQHGSGSVAVAAFANSLEGGLGQRGGKRAPSDQVGVWAANTAGARACCPAGPAAPLDALRRGLWPRWAEVGTPVWHWLQACDQNKKRAAFEDITNQFGEAEALGAVRGRFRGAIHPGGGGAGFPPPQQLGVAPGRRFPPQRRRWFWPHRLGPGLGCAGHASGTPD
jgi:hypothetical protein